jgi:SAM-dependent methyltransferase
VTTLDLSVSSPTDPYGYIAGYYDFLHVGPGSPALVSFFSELAPKGGRALEIGPGTGRMTIPVAERVSSLLCLERSSSMRAVLLTKLGERPDLRDRVTILDDAVPKVSLEGTFDYIFMAAVLEHVPPEARVELFSSLAAHLAPDGVFATDMVHDEPVPDQPETEVRSAFQGECRYTLSSAAWPLGPNLCGVRHVYRTYYHDTLVATETVERRHNLHRPDEVIADLMAAGLTTVGGSCMTDEVTPLSDKGTLIARHTARTRG